MEITLVLILMGGIVALDTTSGPQMLISEPIVTCSTLGLLFGRFETGLIMGMFFEAISMFALTVPLLMPVVIAMGWSPIWFGVVLTLMVQCAAVTPPCPPTNKAVRLSRMDCWRPPTHTEPTTALAAIVFDGSVVGTTKNLNLFTGSSTGCNAPTCPLQTERRITKGT